MRQIRYYREIYELTSKFFLSPTQNKNVGNKMGRLDSFSKEIDKLIQKNAVLKNNKLFRKLYGFPRSQFMAVKFVLTTSQLVGTDRLIAATIAGFYNQELGYCYPNQDQLAKICGVSERVVNTAIQQMKASGEWLITPMQTAPYERAVSNRYYLLPPAGYGIVTQALNGFMQKELNTYQKTGLSIKSIYTNEDLEKEIDKGLNKMFMTLPTSWGYIPSFKIRDEIASGRIDVVASQYFYLPRSPIFGTKLSDKKPDKRKTDKLTPVETTSKRFTFHKRKYEDFIKEFTGIERTVVKKEAQPYVFHG